MKTNQQILNEAPDGATHYDGNFYYRVNDTASKSSEIWDVMGRYTWTETGELRLKDLIDMRSLADIRRIVELETPDMFWVKSDTEKFIHDPRDAFDDIMCESTKVG